PEVPPEAPEVLDGFRMKIDPCAATKVAAHRATGAVWQAQAIQAIHGAVLHRARWTGALRVQTPALNPTRVQNRSVMMRLVESEQRRLQ
ncbi:MAG: hypothetical protein JJU36_18355, partial [Phycisphaeraceae bacterium]|nr:hypothetical protein [Phycisphaeraceae bacterium]